MRPLEQNEFYNYKFLSGLSFSPDGKKAAFIAASVNEEKNSYDSNIWLIRDGKSFRLTGMDSEKAFFWEDDDHILFPAARSASEKKRAEAGEQFTALYRIDVNGGEAVKACELPLQARHFEKIGETGKYLVSATTDLSCPDYYKLSEEDRKKADEARKEEKDYEVCTDTPFWFNGAGFVNGNRSSLFVWDPESGELERITEEKFDVGDYVILDNKVYISGRVQEYKRDMKSDLIAYDLETKETRVVRDDRVYSIHGLDKLDGRLLALMSDNETYGLNQDADVYWLDPETGREELLLGSQGIGNSTGSDCRLGHGRSFKTAGDAAYFVETRRNAAVLCRMDAEGNKTDLWAEEGAVDDFDVSEDGEILICLLRADRLQEIYSLKDGKAEQLTDLNGEALKDVYVAQLQKMTIDSRGTDIDGWVLYPYGYEEGKKYPAVLDIHGGPKTVYGEVFYHEMQYWASKGYFVFFCNPIGGDGRGDEFADIRGKYGTVDYENIMDFTDAVLEKYPDIDREKVCVTGGSYGGYMTNWIIGHTGRFCCAATQRSISNWLSFNGVSDIGVHFGLDQQAADLYESFSPDAVDKLWWHSPLKYAGNVPTPTLFIHSDADYRCPREQGIQLYTALRTRGVEARMCIFHGENHELSRGGKPKHRSRRLKEITDWFERFAR